MSEPKRLSAKECESSLERLRECEMNTTLDSEHYQAIHDHISTLEAELAAGREQERWIPVSERLPFHEPVYFTEVYATDGTKTMTICGWYKPENMDGYNWWSEEDQRFVAPERVIAWMPRLIPSPSAEQEQQK